MKQASLWELPQTTPVNLTPLAMTDLIQFGRYAGQTIEQIAAFRPEYVEWYARENHRPLSTEVQRYIAHIRFIGR